MNKIQIVILLFWLAWSCELKYLLQLTVSSVELSPSSKVYYTFICCEMYHQQVFNNEGIKHPEMFTQLKAQFWYTPLSVHMGWGIESWVGSCWKRSSVKNLMMIRCTTDIYKPSSLAVPVLRVDLTVVSSRAGHPAHESIITQLHDSS